LRAWLKLEDAPTHSWASLEVRPAFLPADERFKVTGPGGIQVTGILRRLPPEVPPPGPSCDADPVLGRKRPFKLDLAALGPLNRRGPRAFELLPAIAESYGVNVVADAYRRQRRLGAVPQSGQELPLYEVLNR